MGKQDELIQYSTRVLIDDLILETENMVWNLEPLMWVPVFWLWNLLARQSLLVIRSSVDHRPSKIQVVPLEYVPVHSCDTHPYEPPQKIEKQFLTIFSHYQ